MKIPVTWWRRISQILFLALFLVLFRMTAYSGEDEIPHIVNIFFRWNPLAAASAMLAARTFIAMMIPALLVMGLTIVLGRFFCGWVCPLGTCLDASHKLITPKSDGSEKKHSSIKYYLLAAALTSALVGIPLVGFVDPFSILIRGLTFGVDPAFRYTVNLPFDVIYQKGPTWMVDISEPVYDFLKGSVISYNQTIYEGALLSFSILAGIFALEKVERRFWCRNLCPLGAMLGLFGRFPLLRMQPGKACKAKDCTSCIDVCRMRAINEQGLVNPESCNLCLDCMPECPKGIISFKFKKPKHKKAPVDVSRRSVLGAVGLGAIFPVVIKANAQGGKPAPFLIRPPGSVPESEFLSRCVRCGECMKVCITNALHPTTFEAGVEGMFSPVLIPRIGYCEYDCTLCGQVCPTQAIERLDVESKREIIIGQAHFVHDRCLPWAKGTPCIVCEEMCPLPEKAITLRKEKAIGYDGEEIEIDRPYVDEFLCIGCGSCEKNCPLDGEAGVRVTNENESRKMDF